MARAKGGRVMAITPKQHKKAVAGLRKLLAHAEARRHGAKDLDERLIAAAKQRLDVVLRAREAMGPLADKPRAQRARGEYVELCKEVVKLQRMIGLAEAVAGSARRR